ncbi:MAG: hypothetical protein ACHQUC_10795, partial [Chlamydiales bacterium]
YEQTISNATSDVNAKEIAVNALLDLFIADQNTLFNSALNTNPVACQRRAALAERGKIIDQANSDLSHVVDDFTNKRNDIKKNNPEIQEHKTKVGQLKENNEKCEGDITTLKNDRPNLIATFTETQATTLQSVKDFTPERKETVYLVDSSKKVTHKTIHSNSEGIYVKDAYRQYEKKNGPLFFDPTKLKESCEFWDKFEKNYGSIKYDSNKTYGISVSTPDGDSTIVYFKGEDIPALKEVCREYSKIRTNSSSIKDNETSISNNNTAIGNQNTEIDKIYNRELIKNHLTDQDKKNALNLIKNQAVRDLLVQQNIAAGKSAIDNASRLLQGSIANFGGGGSFAHLGGLHNLLRVSSSLPNSDEITGDSDSVQVKDPDSGDSGVGGGEDPVSGSQGEDGIEDLDSGGSGAADNKGSGSESSKYDEVKDLDAARHRLRQFLNWAGIKDPETVTVEDEVVQLEVQYARAIIENQHRPATLVLDNFKNLFTLMDWDKSAKVAEVVKLGNEFVSNARTAHYYFDLFLSQIGTINKDGTVKTALQALSSAGGAWAIGGPALVAVALAGQITCHLMAQDKAKQLPPLTHKAFFSFAQHHLMPMLEELKTSIE